MSFRIKEQVPAFSVSNLSFAIEFYSRLGFGVEWRWPKDEPTHVGLRLDRYALMLTLSESSGRGEIYYVVEDVRKCFAAIVDRRLWEVVRLNRDGLGEIDPVPLSLQPPEAPEIREHGHLDFTVFDPWGNQMTFGNEATD